MSAKKKKESPDEIGIPVLVIDCIAEIRERGINEDGILRVSGSAAQIKDLQNTYRKGKQVDLSNVYIHTVGGLLKNFFRDMPKPVLTFEAYSQFLETASMEDEQKVPRLRDLIAQIPMENQELFHKIVVFVREVGKYAKENQMDLNNLATMFGPIFLRKKDQDRAELLHDLQDVISVTHTMLNFDMFEGWPDDQDRHPQRKAILGKGQEKKVREAIREWYGPQWEKEVKKRGNRGPPQSPAGRKTGSQQPHSSVESPAANDVGMAYIGDVEPEQNGEAKNSPHHEEEQNSEPEKEEEEEEEEEG
mmetsp:Transcript_32601/g.44759  ORF Transcript_32601/g.44759 Transcript_32601/m.44759 type:complete len:304 (-) Transcript_32601:243-1154(-)|eukprot:CAMPEP_0201492660 /NCGR_PEP_ID=MMETSP0151_2-20130828/34216_1 /ASSEMBLY_ACC=CAM_ASM_000257 /TAXON_ID=200890 /ORGANISM="Paramoeba atlantica, Strain 621/1 / CCAP 1560/9" /LENGTH=303 /DNA_ID=CAMNT_0047879611 /DNA_START=170 /DNA_END=1081 /DNA_ORIENTATION=+